MMRPNFYQPREPVEEWHSNPRLKRLLESAKQYSSKNKESMRLFKYTLVPKDQWRNKNPPFPPTKYVRTPHPSEYWRDPWPSYHKLSYLDFPHPDRYWKKRSSDPLFDGWVP